MNNEGFVIFDKIDKSYDGEVLGVKNLNLSIEKGEFPQLDPQLMFKALGVLFMGLVLMGDREDLVTDKEVENLLNELIADPNINN